MSNTIPRRRHRFWSSCLLGRRSSRLALALALSVGATAGALTGTRVASAAGPAAVTPKTETPNEARVLSRAFSSVAKALGPSVVRIEVEVGGGPRADHLHNNRPGAPGQGGGDDDDIPPFFRRFFDFGGGDGFPGPSPGPSHGVGSGFILDTTGDVITNRHVIQGRPTSPSSAWRSRPAT